MEPVIVQRRLHLIDDLGQQHGQLVLLDEFLLDELDEADDGCFANLADWHARTPLSAWQEDQLDHDFRVEHNRAVQVFLLQQVLDQSQHIETKFIVLCVIDVHGNDLKDFLPVVDDSGLRAAHEEIKYEAFRRIPVPVLVVLLQVLDQLLKLTREQVRGLLHAAVFSQQIDCAVDEGLLLLQRGDRA